ncbi:hypothetical protein E2C01_086848 [Portunus trituberculatus]|uniref:Uncharacterized protein n=1 Tax=Portunus trituberculatus TaxID=210409 RepID=A0A5B7JAE4_PORTR|nr:hypothetical protein [Portunus trituberculatus]
MTICCRASGSAGVMVRPKKSSFTNMSYAADRGLTVRYGLRLPSFMSRSKDGCCLAVPLGKGHTATGSARLRQGSTRGGVSIHGVLQAWRQGWRVHRGGGSSGGAGVDPLSGQVRGGHVVSGGRRQSFSAPPTRSFTFFT